MLFHKTESNTGIFLLSIIFCTIYFVQTYCSITFQLYYIYWSFNILYYIGGDIGMIKKVFMYLFINNNDNNTD